MRILFSLFPVALSSPRSVSARFDLVSPPFFIVALARCALYVYRSMFYLSRKRELAVAKGVLQFASKASLRDANALFEAYKVISSFSSHSGSHSSNSGGRRMLMGRLTLFNYRSRRTLAGRRTEGSGSWGVFVSCCLLLLVLLRFIAVGNTQGLDKHNGPTVFENAHV